MFYNSINMYFLSIYFHRKLHCLSSYCDYNPDSSFPPLNLGPELDILTQRIISSSSNPPKQKFSLRALKAQKPDVVCVGIHYEFAAV